MIERWVVRSLISAVISLMILTTTAIALADELVSEEVSFVTRDGITIRATLAGPAAKDGQIPAVIFIHQGGSSRAEWVSLPLFDNVIASNMVALAYDVRGHGYSTGEADFNTLFDDPNQAPLDLRAAMDFLIATGRVDKDRIAVVGASIGSNLACVASGKETYNIKTAVAMSGKTSAVLNLAGLERSDLALKSVFHIASEFDQDGRRAEWATELFEMTGAPRKLEIIAESEGHGVSIFADDPSLQERILAWLLETL